MFFVGLCEGVPAPGLVKMKAEAGIQSVLTNKSRSSEFIGALDEKAELFNNRHAGATTTIIAKLEHDLPILIYARIVKQESRPVHLIDFGVSDRTSPQGGP